jgi:hypothetical protein
MSKLLKSWLSNNKTFNGVYQLLFLTLFFLAQSTTSAQIIAGDTALGQVISDPLVDMTISSSFEGQSSFIDLDCDSIADVEVELYKSATAIDGANTAYLNVLNPLFEICADTNLINSRYTVNYYNEADTLVCLDSNDWQNDTIYRLGDYGCMGCQGPWAVDTSYISYRNTATGQQGWMKIYFDLYDGGGWGLPITLSVSEVLSPCENTDLNDSIDNDPISDTTSITCGVFTFDAIVNPTSCSGNCDGSIEILNLTGGTAPYTYLWSHADVNQSVSNLCSGNYLFTITDANGVTCAHTFYVPVAPPMQVSLETTGTGCYGSFDGSMCATVTGGTAPYAYQWSPSSQNGQCATNLTEGVYTVCVTDANGCTVCATNTVIEPDPIQISLQSDSSSCGNSNGSICSTVIGGTPPYTYSWNTPDVPDTTACANNLFAGNYVLTVTDSNGCIAYLAAVMVDVAPIQIALFPNDVSCNGLSDGSICSIVAGGTASYSYNWSPSGSTDSCLNSVTAGTYNLCVTDSNGCVSCAIETITEPTPLVVTDTVINATCPTCNDGEIQLNVIGGTQPYLYSWSPTGNGTNLPIGTYDYCVTDSQNCSSCDSATVSFTTEVKSIDYGVDFSIYPNPTSGLINISSDKLIERVIVRNVLGEIVSESNESQIDISNQANGVYFVEVITTKGKFSKKVILLR